MQVLPLAFAVHPFRIGGQGRRDRHIRNFRPAFRAPDAPGDLVNVAGPHVIVKPPREFQTVDHRFVTATRAPTCDVESLPRDIGHCLHLDVHAHDAIVARRNG